MLAINLPVYWMDPAHFPIGVAAGKFSDVAGNFNDDTFDASTANYEANNQVSIAYNTSATPAASHVLPCALSRAAACRALMIFSAPGRSAARAAPW